MGQAVSKLNDDLMNTFPDHLIARLREARVAAGFSIDDAKHAVPLAKALLAGGIRATELMLRSSAAMEGLQAICKNVPDLLVGVGTILTPEAAVQVKEAGADFGVAPGMNPRVIEAAQKVGLPFAPGIATPTDLERAIECGCRFVKFFPAEPSGGVAYLKSLNAPYKHLGIEYFPLGGVNAENMSGYLSQSHVAAVGGSWIVNKELVEQEDWAGIEARAAQVRDTLSTAKKA